MPIYTFICPACSSVQEEYLGMAERHEAACNVCGAGMRRHFSADIPAIHGDTVAGGVNYSGFDEGLGTYCRGRTHRQQLMKEKGLVEHQFTPHEQEMLYGMKNGAASTPDGRAAFDKVAKEADALDTKVAVERTLGNTVREHALKYMAGQTA